MALTIKPIDSELEQPITSPVRWSRNRAQSRAVWCCGSLCRTMAELWSKASIPALGSYHWLPILGCVLPGSHPSPLFPARYLSHTELAPLRAPLIPMEHCTTRFFETCDLDNDKYIALEEWAGCFGIKERECWDLGVGRSVPKGWDIVPSPLALPDVCLSCLSPLSI